MNEERRYTGGLSAAQRRIADLLAELESTTEFAYRLSANGRHQEALRLVEEQRQALKSFASELASDVAAPRPIRRGRRLAVSVACAAMLVAGVPLTAGRSSPRPSEAAAQLVQAKGIPDPAERLRVLTALGERSRGLDGDAADSVRRTIADAITDTSRDLRDGDTKYDDVITQAERVAEALRQGRAPTPPQSVGEPPVERAKRTLGQ